MTPQKPGHENLDIDPAEQLADELGGSVEDYRYDGHVPDLSELSVVSIDEPHSE